ncbi:hypothetical protein C2E23DRAFT_720024 [Lenzites betulinus]|nr:hypothetical protein C2E23DRAFT_720024 [Lenzites betulinus]
MPHFTTTYPMSEVGQHYASMNTDTSWVNFKISVTRLRQLKARVVEVVEHANPISAQDVLTAYITIVLNRYLETPITVITNVISYHNVPQVVHSTRVAGNALCIIPTIPIQRQPFSTISETAVAVRQSILMCRDPTFIEEYMTVASTLLLAAANRNHSPFFEAFPGKLAVNSHATYVFTMSLIPWYNIYTSDIHGVS